MASSARSVPSIRLWRERALDYVLGAALAIGAVPLAYVFLLQPHAIPSQLRLFGVVIYLALVALTVVRRLPYTARCWGAILAVYAFAGVLLIVRGVEGTGRLFLVVLPIHATVLLGARSGWLAAVASVGLYGATGLLHTGALQAPFDLGGDGLLERQEWVFQGVMLLVVLGPVMVLVTRFIGTLQETLTAESDSAARARHAEREGRRLQKVLLQTSERERRTIGHQLHDGPCQQITAALVRCKVAQNTLASKGQEEEIAHLEAIASMLDASVGEIHDLARGLSHPGLGSGPLASALGELTREVRESGIACEYACDGAGDTEDPAVVGQLLRIAQEAVRNAVRHARPGRIEIGVARNDGFLTLRVQDDGVGMPSTKSGDRMGISIMRYRAELMGGSLSITPAPGGGTSVTCALPLGAAPENPAEAS
jgi:signal transduction histidine kinase